MDINDNLKNKISYYSRIKCHTCLQNINSNNINNFFKMPKSDKGKYYCSKICYNFI